MERVGPRKCRSISRRCSAAEGYRFNDKAIDAYVKSQKQQALAADQGNGQDHPQLNSWIGWTAMRRCAPPSYGSPKPANVLLMMYSLSLGRRLAAIQALPQLAVGGCREERQPRAESQYFTASAAEVGDPRRPAPAGQH